MMITGTAGDDDLVGTEFIDDFYLGDGGDDIAHGLGGDDSFGFGDKFTGDDSVFGGSGFDTIHIIGAMGTIRIDGDTIDSVERLFFGDVSDYTLSMKNSAVADGKTLIVDAAALSIGHSLKLFASTELDGAYQVVSGADNDTIETGQGNDTILTAGGNDRVNAGFGKDTVSLGDGDDTVFFTGDGAFDHGDRVDGGLDGFVDTLHLSGDYSAGLTVTSKMIVNLGRVELQSGNDYNLDFSGANADLHFVGIDASELDAGDTLTFTGGDNKHVGFSVKGGAGADTITSGMGENNELKAGGGADTVIGNSNGDVFWYDEVTDSIGPAYDTAIGFNAAEDLVFVLFTGTGVPDAVDPMVKHGSLSTATFDADLEDEIGTAQLGEGNAVLYQAKHGTLEGVLFLIVDGNGEAGYQGGDDLVVRFDDGKHMADFDITNFGNFG